MTDTQTFDHDDLRALLPWHVNGTLEGGERERVRSHLKDCRECRDETALLESMQSALERDMPAPLIPEPDVDGLLARIDQSAAPVEPNRRAGTVILAAVAAAAVLVAVVELAVPGRDSAPRYETVTSDQSAGAIAYVLDVRFRADADERLVRRVLNDIGAEKIGPGGEAGVERIRVVLDEPSLSELEAFIARTRERADIESISVVSAGGR